MEKEHNAEQIKQRWIEGIRSDREEDYAALIAAYKESVFRVTNDILRDRALAQKSTEATFRNMRSLLSAGAQFGAFDYWLITLARNNAMAMAGIFVRNDEQNDSKMAGYIRRIKQNDHTAQRDVIEDSYKKIYATVSTVLKERAEIEAIVGVVYETIFILLENGAEPQSIDSWMNWIALNNAISFGEDFYSSRPKQEEIRKVRIERKVNEVKEHHSVNGQGEIPASAIRVKKVCPAVSAPGYEMEKKESEEQRPASPKAAATAYAAVSQSTVQKNTYLDQLDAGMTIKLKEMQNSVPPSREGQESRAAKAPSPRTAAEVLAELEKGTREENTVADAPAIEEKRVSETKDTLPPRKSIYASEEFQATFSHKAPMDTTVTQSRKQKSIFKTSHSSRPKEKPAIREKRSRGVVSVVGILVTTLLVLVIALLLWILVGLLMKNGIVPSLDWGYQWFNQNIFSLF